MNSSTLIIGIFFDGTGNNGFNSQRGENHACATDSVSYSNDPSNIFHLFQRYKKGVVADDKLLWQTGIYIEGIGTAQGQPDNIVPDMAFGTGERGVMARVRQSMMLISQVLDYAGKNPLLADIKTVRFDIFGFSRGAAAARHLANILFDDAKNPHPASRQCLHQPAFSHLAFNTRFLGLFDTVAAIALPANGMSTRSRETGDIILRLPIGVAERVFHLVAEHECRYNFPLSSVKPYYPELIMPGVHADIGGGYRDNSDEDLLLSQPAYNTVADAIPAEQTRVYKQATVDTLLLKNNLLWGPVLRDAELSVCQWQRPAPEDKRLGMMKQAASAVRVRRRVGNAWAWVALSVMIEAAGEAGSEFESGDIAKKIPALLKPVADKVLAQGRALRAGVAVAPLSTQERALIAGKFIHCSANWNEVEEAGRVSAQNQLAWPVRPLKLMNFINRPDEHWQRLTLIY